jgi:hypothetical protein
MDVLFKKTKGYNKDSITFHNDGTLYACVYSYEIGSYGDIELNEKETKELYLKMKEYFKNKGE